MRETLLTLDQLPAGQSGRVTTVTAQGLTRRRLLDLGLVDGSKVEAVRRSATGDPMAFSVRGTLLALRKKDARLVLVRVL